MKETASPSREHWYGWAVVELDRPVEGRQPLDLHTDAALPRGTALGVVGHPSGIPMKAATGVVLKDDKIRYFNTDLDIY